MRPLAPYSQPLERAPKRLLQLIERDTRIVGYTIEEDGCFIYTNSSQWCDDAGAGTFCGATVTEAIRTYRAEVRAAQ